MIEQDVFKVSVENMKTCQAPDGRRRKRGRAKNNNHVSKSNLNDSSKGSIVNRVMTMRRNVLHHD